MFLMTFISRHFRRSRGTGLRGKFTVWVTMKFSGIFPHASFHQVSFQVAAWKHAALCVFRVFLGWDDRLDHVHKWTKERRNIRLSSGETIPPLDLSPCLVSHVTTGSYRSYVLVIICSHVAWYKSSSRSLFLIFKDISWIRWWFYSQHHWDWWVLGSRALGDCLFFRSMSYSMP